MLPSTGTLCVRWPRLCLVTLTACVLVAPNTVRAQPYPYSIEDLGKLSGADGSVALAINASGDVVGWSNTSPTRAFLFTDDAGMVELPGLSGHVWTVARGINDDRVIVGSGWAPHSMPRVALRWTNGVAAELGLLSGSAEGYDINVSGHVVGMSPLDALDTHTFFFTDANGMLDIGPDLLFVRGYDVNANDQVVGNTWEGGYRWSSSGGFEPLGDIIAQAVNVSGQVSGLVKSSSGFVTNLVRFTDGLGIVDLGFLSDDTSDPVSVGGMNAQGDIVGQGKPEGRDITRAFIYTDGSGIQALQNMLDPADAVEWFLYDASDINDAGQIVGTGRRNSIGEWRAFRLTPTTPVGLLAQLALTPVRVEAETPATGWVTLSAPAPPGGAIVTLSSDDPTIATVPAQVVVPEGERNGSFEVTTHSVTKAASTMIRADLSGDESSATLEVTPATPTNTGDSARAPDAHVVDVYPNPGVDRAEIRYRLFNTSGVQLRIYGVDGRLIRTLVVARQAPGLHLAHWDSRDDRGIRVSAGIYLFEFETDRTREVGRIIVVR